jgi:ABC-type spermidine/putrescine transport systems, ATPase components
MDAGSVLEVTNLTKIFFNTQDGIAGGVSDASFTLTPGTFFTLLGPSGCGKTTTLRCVAGLEQPDSGLIRLGDRVIFDGAAGVSVPLNRRNMGMVFQSYAIWPHMTVFENVAFPLRVANDRKYARAEIVKLVGEALTRVGLNGFQTRSATRLSGGQQQRVALARAIVRQPKLLLLDEPLSNLDATLRDEMRNELKRLQREVGVTTIYVTHDQTEALEMSDLVAVIDKGRIMQMGHPRDIYFHPRNAFVAGFVGSTNLLPAKVTRQADGSGIAAVTLDGVGDIGCAFENPLPVGEAIAVSIRPETIRLKAAGEASGADVNRLSGRIALGGFLGNMNRYTVKVGPHSLQVNTDAHVVFETGADVALEFPRSAALGVPNAA